MSTGTVKFYNWSQRIRIYRRRTTLKAKFSYNATGLLDQIAQNDKVTYEVKDGNQRA